MNSILVSKNNDSIQKNDAKCIECGYCKRVCANEITILKMYDIKKTKTPICINCGQCTNICPTEALSERIHYSNVKRILKNKNKIKTISIAPAVRVAIGEAFNIEPGINTDKKIVTALKKLGFNYVFDINFGADLTIMEEASELIERIKNKNGTMFTSCCPAWVRFVEIFHPDLIPNLSTCKSPIAMQSTIIKTYFAKENDINPKDIVDVVVAPCTAKKAEIKQNYTHQDTDYAITTRELITLLKEKNINIAKLKESSFSSPLNISSSSGAIFGSSGGVAIAALRTAYYFLTNENLKPEDLKFDALKGMQDIKEAEISINDLTIKVAVCNGLKSAIKVIEKLKNKEVYYDLVEVMTCKGGCTSGGGQPKITMLDMAEVRQARMNGLYKIDEKSKLRLCHENPEIKKIYKKYLKEPLSEKSEILLHRSYIDRSSILGGKHD